MFFLIMNYLALQMLHPTYIFELLFTKYNIPLELIIIIFEYIDKKDLFNFYKNFTNALEIHCIFNKELFDKWNKDYVKLQNKINITKKKINNLCFNCKNNESQELLLNYIKKYNTQETILQQKYITFFNTRTKFLTKMSNNSFILKYYECVQNFNRSEIIKRRRETYIKHKFSNNIKQKPTIWVSYDKCQKKNLIKILDENNIEYNKSWNKSRLVNAYYKNC